MPVADAILNVSFALSPRGLLAWRCRHGRSVVVLAWRCGRGDALVVSLCPLVCQDSLAHMSPCRRVRPPSARRRPPLLSTAGPGTVPPLRQLARLDVALRPQVNRCGDDLSLSDVTPYVALQPLCRDSLDWAHATAARHQCKSASDGIATICRSPLPGATGSGTPLRLQALTWRCGHGRIVGWRPLPAM